VTGTKRPDAGEVERYLHRHIPLTAAMGVHVAAVSLRRAELHAPLAPNINHRETLFGGSAAALAILASWTVLHVRCVAAGSDARLVIQRHDMTYAEPISGDFAAVCELTDEPAWDRFLATLERRGRSRIALTAQLVHASRVAASSRGDFVALRSSGPRPGARSQGSPGTPFGC
jgi:thioesterase domain-containing protein